MKINYQILAVLFGAWFLSTTCFAADAPAGKAAQDKEHPTASASEKSSDTNNDSTKADDGKKTDDAKGDTTEKAPVVPLAESLQGTAKSEYEAGSLLYRDGDFAAALIKFQRAYDQSHDGRLLWNMAVCEKQLRHYVRLLEYVERYQREAADKLTDQDKQQAQALIEAVKKFVSTVNIQANVKGSTVLLDGTKVDVTPLAKPLLVDMGERTIEITKEGYLPYKQKMQISGNTEVVLNAVLQEDKNEGELQVIAKPGQTIWIDGKAVGQGTWKGTVTSGGHTVRVSAKGMRSYQNEVDVPKHGSKNLHITLEKEVVPIVQKEDSNAWMWLTGGAVLLTGAGIGAYFLFRPEQEPIQSEPTVIGTIPPGAVQLP